MFHPTFGTELAEEHEREIADSMRRMRARTHPRPPAIDGADVELTIRFARSRDLEPLRRLVDLDGSGGGTRHMLLDLTRPGAPPRVLIAAAGEKPLAALHLDTGHGATDPFERSGTALELLRARAKQLGLAPPERRSGRLAALRGRLGLSAG